MIVGVKIENGSCDRNHTTFRVKIDIFAHSDSIEFICAIQKTLMYVCMHVIHQLRHDIVYPYIKFYDSRFNLSRDIIGGRKILSYICWDLT